MQQDLLFLSPWIASRNSSKAIAKSSNSSVDLVSASAAAVQLVLIFTSLYSILSSLDGLDIENNVKWLIKCSMWRFYSMQKASSRGAAIWRSPKTKIKCVDPGVINLIQTTRTKSTLELNQPGWDSLQWFQRPGTWYSDDIAFALCSNKALNYIDIKERFYKRRWSTISW